ncbi:MAG: FAD-dependent oxidoreductase [Terriglobia bacterium]
MSLSRRSLMSRLMMALGSSRVGKAEARELAPGHLIGLDQPSDRAQYGATQAGGSTGVAGYIRPGTIEVVQQEFEVVVVGGGISGTCAAISAARNGARVALVHERSTLGGNSSSEVRLYPEDTCDFTPWIKESGLLEEIRAEERVRNWEPYIEGMMNCHWDLVLYEWATRENNLTLFLNTTMREVRMLDDAHILAIHGAQLGTEKEFIIKGALFIDATGDGVLGYRAGADFRWGAEPYETYQEPLARELPSNQLMGNTLYFRARNTGTPVEFRKPEWAAEFDTEADLTERDHGGLDLLDNSTIETGYWWIEVGVPLHPIKDNEKIRHEALRQLLGVWDHIKNRCTADQVRARAANYALEFVGFWPYKRESRRIIGDYVLRQEDVRNPPIRDDDIAYGGWGIDIHVPGGILQRRTPPYPEPSSDANWPQLGTIPYGIPLRCCYSRNILNLLMAGRTISTSYIAFSSSRVLTTGAVVGQAVGAAAALCHRYSCAPRDIVGSHAAELQQLLVKQDGFIPGVANRDLRDLARTAQVTASSEGPLAFPLSDSFRPAGLPLAQLFPVSTDHIDAIELLLKSTLKAPAEVEVALRDAAHVWDFRASGDLASSSAVIQPGFEGFIRFALNTKTKPGKFYYAYIGRHEGVAWALHADEPGKPSLVPVGTTPADLPGGNRWRPLAGGQSFCIRLSPEQRPYSPTNLVRGGTRPDLWTNFYTSDPAQPFPQWIELSLSRPTRISQIHITFDTDVNRHVDLPLYRSYECVKQYDVAAWVDGQWKAVAAEGNNYHRKRVHSFDPVVSDRIRINIHSTHGAKAARLYEVRVYEA